MVVARSFSVALVCIFATACAVTSVPPERLDKVAVITSGSTNAFLLTKAPTVVAVDRLDGVPVANRYGPIEVVPGPHVVTMTCGNRTNDDMRYFSAGDIYEFGIIYLNNRLDCDGTLVRVRTGIRTAEAEAWEAAARRAAAARAVPKSWAQTPEENGKLPLGRVVATTEIAAPKGFGGGRDRYYRHEVKLLSTGATVVRDELALFSVGDCVALREQPLMLVPALPHACDGPR